MKQPFFAITLGVALLTGCAQTAYVPRSQTMDVRSARAIVEHALTTSNLQVGGNWTPSAKVHAARVRGDGFGVAVQDASIDWSLFNNVKYGAPGLRTCPFASVNPALTDFGPLGSPRYGVEMPGCEMRIFFHRHDDAKNFVDALYTLKVNAGR